MPVRSIAQNRAMWAAREGHSTLGIPASVGREFTAGQQGHPGILKGLPQKVGDTPPRQHALSMASATHLHNMGHISTAHRDHIHRVSRDMMTAARNQAQQPMQPAAPTWGSMAPSPNGNQDNW